jgi:hypothetical protein
MTGLHLDKTHAPTGRESGKALQIAPVGVKRVGGRAAFDAEHFQKGLDKMIRTGRHHCLLLSTATSMVTVRLCGSARIPSAASPARTPPPRIAITSIIRTIVGMVGPVFTCAID